MLTEQEKSFMEYWEKNRLKQKRSAYGIAIGLPAGILFGLPILVSVLFHDWYKSMIYISPSQIVVIAIAVIAISIFIAIFKMKFTWENNEQLYKELKHKDQSK
jgi:preprotein translocase subunit Sec61beta